MQKHNIFILLFIFVGCIVLIADIIFDQASSTYPTPKHPAAPPNQTISPDVKTYLDITSDIPKSMSNEEKAALIQAIGAERSARLQAKSTDRNTIIIAIATCLAAGIGIIGQLKDISNYRKNRKDRTEMEQQESETIHI
ncbi:hypothetical protein [Laceyella putida]|uniref:Uncharacterized protein n=1 Tax=Laceyella putida TaxID=110101 RepID=A0ABW2RN89_9BACL